MKNQLLCITLSAMVIAGLMGGCKEDPPASLYQPKASSGPSLTSLSPTDSAFAGVTTVTIAGSGFSTVKEYNFVYFGSMLGTVLDATATQLKVLTPILVSDSTPVKIAVQGMDLFSNAMAYKLKAAVVEFGAIPNTVEEPYGITCDAAGNVYVSFLSGTGTGLGVKKFIPSGARSDYSPAFSSAINKWTSLKFGPGGYIYAASNRNAVFRIPVGGGGAAPWANTGAVGVSSVFDIDFDSNNNIWGAGDNQSIVRITPGAPGAPPAGSKAFPFVGDVRSIRFFQNFLYLATKNDSVWNIWRTQVFGADSIGPRELYLNFSTKFGASATPNAITFANDGDLLVATDSSAGSIVVVHPDKTVEKFYPGLFGGNCITLAYGAAREMYVAQTGTADAKKKVLKVDTQKQGAPNYGR